MKKIIRTALLAFPLMMFAACGGTGGDQHGETNLKEEPQDVNKRTVDEAQQMNDDKDSIKSSCTDFVTQAAHDGMNEVEMGTLAAEKATTKEVKVFAQRMIADHSKANAELKELAMKKSIILPTEKDPKATDHAMKAEKGIGWDKEYMDMMVSDHKKAIDLFQDAADDCDDADIKAFASQKLDILKQHLKTAETIQESLKTKK